jgi:hypothetical protein
VNYDVGMGTRFRLCQGGQPPDNPVHRMSRVAVVVLLLVACRRQDGLASAARPAPVSPSDVRVMADAGRDADESGLPSRSDAAAVSPDSAAACAKPAARPLPWVRAQVIGLEVNRHDRDGYFEAWSFGDGSVAATFGREGGPVTGPAFDWRIRGRRLQILDFDDRGRHKVHTQFELLCREGSVLVLRQFVRGRGSSPTHYTFSWLGLPAAPPFIKVTPDGRSVAIKLSGDSYVDRIDVLDACDDAEAGESRIRRLEVKRGKVSVTFGKHCHATIVLKTRTLRCDGCD